LIELFSWTFKCIDDYKRYMLLLVKIKHLLFCTQFAVLKMRSRSNKTHATKVDTTGSVKWIINGDANRKALGIVSGDNWFIQIVTTIMILVS
jgi:hypothetical protein